MKIKVNDQVVIIAGKDRNKTGKVLRVLEKSNRVVVEGINVATRHMRKTKTQKGQKVQFNAPLSASNVMFIDPKTKKPTRVGYNITKEGKKERIAKKSKTVI
jgi:large subunit ribosomal protein L24